MAEGNNRIESVDAQTPSPSQRASFIWNRLRTQNPDATDWDLLCFAVEFIGVQSQQYPWLEKEAKAVARLVYTAHYLNFGEQDVSSGVAHKPQAPSGGHEGRKPQSNSPRTSSTRITFGGSEIVIGESLHVHDNDS